MRQISDEDRREIAKELREQFYCCRYAEGFTEGLYDVFSPVHYELNRGCYPERAFPDQAQRDERDVPRLRDVEQRRVGEHGPAAVPPGGGHARGQLEQPVIRSAVELYRATAWHTVPDLVSGPARRALVHGHSDAPHVTAAQIGETERRARALERDRARALKRSRKANR